MGTGRIEQAIARIEDALGRLESVRGAGLGDNLSADNSPRLLALVDRHEKLREEVAETLRDLDSLISDIEA